MKFKFRPSYCSANASFVLGGGSSVTRTSGTSTSWIPCTTALFPPPACIPPLPRRLPPSFPPPALVPESASFVLKATSLRRPRKLAKVQLRTLSPAVWVAAVPMSRWARRCPPLLQPRRRVPLPVPLPQPRRRVPLPVLPLSLPFASQSLTLRLPPPYRPLHALLASLVQELQKSWI